jgi:integrase
VAVDLGQPDWAGRAAGSSDAQPRAANSGRSGPDPEEAWRDPAWGGLLWVAMTTGARRGELCAIRRSSLNLDPGRETVWLRRAIRKDDGGNLVACRR